MKLAKRSNRQHTGKSADIFPLSKCEKAALSALVIVQAMGLAEKSGLCMGTKMEDLQHG